MTSLAQSDSTPAKVLSVVALNKGYGGLKAVDDVSFEVFEGEILALVGDNGAGKSTLVKAIAGTEPPDSGQIEVDGAARQLNTPRDASAAGIGCLHQGLGLVDSLNVPENVFLGRELQTNLLNFIPQLDHARMRKRTIELLSGFGISLPRLNDPVIRLSGGQRQTVAISRLLLQDVRLIIMDEPMAALGVEEGRRVLELVRNMKNREISVIVISHNLEHVFQLADRRWLFQGIGLTAVIVVLAVLFVLINPRFGSITKLTNILTQASFIIVISVGMTFVITSAGIDLSVGSAVALITVIAFGLIKGGLNPFLGVLFMFAFGAFIGGLIGGAIAYVKIPPFIATLGFMAGLRGLALVHSAGEMHFGLPTSLTFIGQGEIARVPVPVIISLATAVFGAWLFNRTRFGLYVKAVGGLPIYHIPLRKPLPGRINAWPLNRTRKLCCQMQFAPMKEPLARLVAAQSREGCPVTLRAKFNRGFPPHNLGRAR